ncbi:hypothetical protein OSB04_025416 [Centaurea solstitialis]|uniref:Uncharacterized protein n=1 Tax=Centaurea solstitialis TaxID=347529 RepID=A0AA38SPN7_9ASTR|nr:hypothetical protein OSB04_025416 [Centaurea solstitialis]
MPLKDSTETKMGCQERQERRGGADRTALSSVEAESGYLGCYTSDNNDAGCCNHDCDTVTVAKTTVVWEAMTTSGDGLMVGEDGVCGCGSDGWWLG